MSELRWTKKTPTASGWYFLRNFDAEDLVVEVLNKTSDGGRVSYWYGFSEIQLPGEAEQALGDLLWAGPIPEPGGER
jgi:hypothetical protein